jgi:hypothetical protein
MVITWFATFLTASSLYWPYQRLIQKRVGRRAEQLLREIPVSYGCLAKSGLIEREIRGERRLAIKYTAKQTGRKACAFLP